MTRERLGRRLQGAAVLGVGALGSGFSLRCEERPVPEDPPRLPAAVSTQPARAGSGAIRVRGVGTVRPSAEVPIAAEVGGRVSWVSPAFVGGGRIAQGEALLCIDSTRYENAVDVALADVEQEQVDLLEAEAEVRQAMDEWDRLAARSGSVSERPNALVTRRPQVEATRAALRRAEVRLKDARIALRQTSVRVPFDGTVSGGVRESGQDRRARRAARANLRSRSCRSRLAPVGRGRGLGAGLEPCTRTGGGVSARR